MSPQSKPSILVYNVTDNNLVFQANSNVQRPIASIVKLMTAMVALDQFEDLSASLQLSQCSQLEEMGIDPIYVEPLTGIRHEKIRNTIPQGVYTVKELIKALLIVSDNTAAETFAEHYPGGRTGFIQAMNNKAKSLKMFDTVFVDAPGVSDKNISTADNLNKMIMASLNYPMIVESSPVTQEVFNSVELGHLSKDILLQFNSITKIIKSGLSQTSHHCLAMAVEHKSNVYTISLLGAPGYEMRKSIIFKLISHYIYYKLDNV